jgi:hypothetical protein
MRIIREYRAMKIAENVIQGRIRWLAQACGPAHPSGLARSVQ